MVARTSGKARGLGVTQARNVALLVVLGVGWGSTQPLGKIAASTGHGAFALIFWQLVICTVFLGAITLLRGRGLPMTRRALVFYLVVALLAAIVAVVTALVLPGGWYVLTAGILASAVGAWLAQRQQLAQKEPINENS